MLRKTFFIFSFVPWKNFNDDSPRKILLEIGEGAHIYVERDIYVFLSFLFRFVSIVWFAEPVFCEDFQMTTIICDTSATSLI